MRPTPKTDAEYWKQYPNGTDGWDFARTLERDLAEARELLVNAVAHIKAWHNMGMTDEQGAPMWNIYWNNAPEMKPLREFLSRTEPK